MLLIQHVPVTAMYETIQSRSQSAPKHARNTWPSWDEEIAQLLLLNDESTKNDEDARNEAVQRSKKEAEEQRTNKRITVAEQLRKEKVQSIIL